MLSLQFSKKFPLPKNGGHFEMAKHEFASISLTVRDRAIEFLPKMAKHKFACISLTVRDRVIFRRNFRPTGYLSNVLFAIFKKFSPPQKWLPF